MKDSFGREIDYLRISVTQRCNLRCIYCGCEAPDKNEMTADEILKAVRAFASLGITKVRLTGGEPLLREDIGEIIAGVKATEGIRKVALTTNGVLLSRKMSELVRSGVDSVNISIDSLDKKVYHQITGHEGPEGILNALDLLPGHVTVRLNAVLVRGVNDSSADELIAFARNRKIDVRFIELMPFSETCFGSGSTVTADEILAAHPGLKPVAGDENAVAEYYAEEGAGGRVGFISPMSRKFCSSCSRIRLLSDGKIRPCLGFEETADIRPVLNDPEKLTEVIRNAILRKPACHRFGEEDGTVHAMNRIGG